MKSSVDGKRISVGRGGAEQWERTRFRPFFERVPLDAPEELVLH